jgi:hypothetical protein
LEIKKNDGNLPLMLRITLNSIPKDILNIVPIKIRISELEELNESMKT